MKRKNPSENLPSSQPTKQLKSSDVDISSAWWNAALVAINGNPWPLTDVLDAKEGDSRKVNWNFAPLDGRYRGVSLAFIACELALDQQSTLLNILLLSLPLEKLKQLSWETGPQDVRHPYYGTTLSWMAAYLNAKEKGNLLIEALSMLDESALKKLNWNAQPKNRPTESAISFAWLIASAAFYKMEKIDYPADLVFDRLEKILMNNSDNLGMLNWNSSLPPNQEENIPNTSLAWFAAFFNYSNMAQSLLKKLLNSSSETLAQLNWNSDISHAESTLAFIAVILYDHNKDKRLLEKMLTLPTRIMQKINWNAGPREDQTVYYGGVTLAWMAAYLALEHQDLRLIIKLSESMIEPLIWDVSPIYEFPNKSAGGIESYHEVELTWMAVKIAKNNKLSNTLLLEMLLNSPRQVLKKINWKPTIKIAIGIERKKNKDSLFGAILTTIPEKLSPQYYNKLFQPEIVSTLTWNRSLKQKFIELIDKEQPENGCNITAGSAECIKILSK